MNHCDPECKGCRRARVVLDRVVLDPALKAQLFPALAEKYAKRR